MFFKQINKKRYFLLREEDTIKIYIILPFFLFMHQITYQARSSRSEFAASPATRHRDGNCNRFPMMEINCNSKLI